MEPALREENSQLSLPARLVEEALAQDDQQLCLDEICAPRAGSADYERSSHQFKVEHIAPSLPAALHDPEGASFMRQGVLPEIRHMWRSFESDLVLWKYADPRAPEVTQYRGVTQQIVTVATARPKAFVTGVSYFLIISTPIDISLHALRFAPGSDRLLPLARTPYVVATDDVVVGAIASDSCSGRIFLGGSDGCIHELQYFDNEASWLGPSKRTRKSIVSWTFQSRLPTFLRKLSEAIFEPAASILQMEVDTDRRLLFALSSVSSISIFQIPVCRTASGLSEELPLAHLCSMSTYALSSEVARIKAQYYPGLAPPGNRGLNVFGVAAVGTAQVGPRAKLVKLLPVGKPQGGSIILCVVAEDGTRIFLRGITNGGYRLHGGVSIDSNMLGFLDSNRTATSSGIGVQRGSPLITGLVVHHVRFLDSSCPGLCVKDAISADGITLLVSRVTTKSDLRDLAAGLWGGGSGYKGTCEPAGGDVVVAISADLRAVAQRQSRGRSPWLTSPLGLAEHANIVAFGLAPGTCQVMAIADFSSRLPQPLESLYSGGTSNGMILPVHGLSELAREQLLPAPRFLLVSTLGVHVLTKIQPLDVLRHLVLTRDVPLLRDFTLQYTAEQTCAMCFQLLTAVVSRPGELPGATFPHARAPIPIDSTMAPTSLPASRVGLQNNAFVTGPTQVLGAQQQQQQQRQQRQQQQQAAVSTRSSVSWRDPDEELMLLHTEQLLLTPQLAAEMGFVQAWPSADLRMTQPGTFLGHSIQVREAHRISGRLRGLCLYLSRILRPIWLTPVMAVKWPARPVDSCRSKRRRDEWWPPAPEPPPEVNGAQWRCSWSKAQRSHIHNQLVKLTIILERIKCALGSERLDARAAFAGPDPCAGGSLPEGALATGISLLVETAIQALAFLELVAARAEVLSMAKCTPETLVRFAELTFRDLVCQPEARKVLQQLMCGGVLACRQLHAKCPQLFSVIDLEVQEACELLSVVQSSMSSVKVGGSTLDMAHLNQLVQRALRTLERHAATVDLEEVSTRLRLVGAYKGLIALCARIARARDPRDESVHVQDPTNARVQQLHYARLECYQVVLELLEDIFVRVQQHQVNAGVAIVGIAPAMIGEGTGAGVLRARGGEVPELLPVPVSEADAVPLLDAFLRHCLEGQPYLADELFHFCVLKWVLQRGLPVYRYDSPYLKGFLERHAQDQPELLCRYFQHRGRWAEAYDAIMALVHGSRSANGQPHSVNECRVLLQSAALCAQMPGSNRQVEPILRAMRELSEVRAGQHDVEGRFRLHC